MNYKNILIFISGVAVGVLATTIFFKRKGKEVEEEFEDEDECCLPTDDDFSEVDSPKEMASKNVSKKNEIYNEIIKKNSYNTLPPKNEPLDEKPIRDEDHPYVISFDAYEDPNFDEFEKIGLIYYSDGVLADDMDECVEDADEAVGTEFMKHFGEGDDPDTVYVRNSRRKADFEIVREKITYEESVGNYR